ncbi:MAG: CoB--CoM heterodisulfide reductase iron-sulfur subunit B family protein [Desulfoplanes sp.]|nr:CoB--CoM heterodisulfide reductase iron-sulfur subunit B family protein [Desulfoplanes sp.]
MEKCGLYLGCNIPFKAPDIEQSLRQVFPPLGVEIVDLPGAPCCPAWGTAPSFDIDTWLALSARNIALAEKQGVDVMTGCNSCFGVLSEAKHVIDASAAKKDVVNEKLATIDSAYAGSSKIYHIGHILHEKIGTEKIKKNLRYSLDGLTAAVQPGCHLLWPTKSMEVTEENPFFPTMLSDLCGALGLRAPTYSNIEACCGMGAMRSTDQEKSFILAKEKLVRMKEELNPDMIVTTCSSCYLQLDGAQKIFRDRGEIDFEIPVFYYTQLLALCMGADPAEVACISDTPRAAIIAEIQSEQRRMK